ncbi:YggS family pyridoxal phosphate-dependent enzyme [Parvularcula maris]|uniref:Pyridoxal phosphate homeostasis protein n=1 Tax=Parvularcula maris TaxID=2965077 RepID=A0A9X2LB28_9PROT|nr:YggS family pyridoxal phosphate-dependent enzyme [Parvularcula maris]MCQ8186281.1 YggS family pyridoxal phosphate-dependent enzyme [Parvularcula maris]
MNGEERIRNLHQVREAIAKAAEEAGRDPGDVGLTAVSKMFTAEDIRPLLEAGHRQFGENRVQESAGKWPALREEFGGLELRLIGPLQSNKAADAVALFDVIETVDRPKIAKVLASEMEKQERSLPVFVQVNTGEEPQKAGVAPSEAVSFVKHCRDELGLEVVGLMAIPPAGAVPAPHFALLRRLAERSNLARVSMGMSGDYEAAVSLGSTEVRVGSGIFGPRPSP